VTGKVQRSWTYYAVEIFLNTLHVMWPSVMLINPQSCPVLTSVLDWTSRCCQKSFWLPLHAAFSCLHFMFYNLLLVTNFLLSDFVNSIFFTIYKQFIVNCWSTNPIRSWSIWTYNNMKVPPPHTKYIPCILIIIKVFSPTDAQLDSLKTISNFH